MEGATQAGQEDPSGGGTAAKRGPGGGEALRSAPNLKGTQNNSAIEATLQCSVYEKVQRHIKVVHKTTRDSAEPY